LVEQRPPKPSVVGSNPTRPAYLSIWENMFAKITKFISEVVVELKKVSWSTRSELIQSTQVVLLSTALLGLFIAVVDVVISQLVGVVIK
jgi:preprotein translocase subunit SecE